MKLAWICYEHHYDLDEVKPVILFSEPERYRYHRIVPIVYTELKEYNEPDR